MRNFKLRFSRGFGAAEVVLLAVALCAVSARSQTYRGSIRGQVRDASGAAVSGAAIHARKMDIGLERSTTTAEDGGYVLPEMSAGEYEVRAEAKGLETVTQKVLVAVGADTTADFDLARAATVRQQVTVVETVPLMETTRDVLGGTVENRLVEELPLNGRDFGKLVALVPGVTVEASGVAGTEKGFGQFNINGNRDRSNNYTLDGTDNNDPFFNNSALNQVGITGAPATLLPIDAIQEFNLQSQFPAEYGRNSGSVVNIITKSGTNQFHGSLFEYHRNKVFDARNFFNVKPNPQSPFINNQFGGSLGGPIVHNRTFFFLAYEGQRERVGSDFNLFVPTAADIANAKAEALANPAAAGLGLTAANLNPALDKILAFFPSSTTRTLPAAVKDKNDLDNFIVKVDQKITEEHSFAARYAFGQSDQIFPLGGLGGFGNGSRLAQFAQVSPTRVQVVSLSLLSVFDSRHVNEARFGYSRFRTSFSSADASFNPASIGLNLGTGKLALPEFDFAGSIENLGATGFSVPRGRVSQSFQFLDNVTVIAGKHTFKFGGEYRRAAVNSFNDNLERGLFSVNSTIGPACVPSPPPNNFCNDPVINILGNFYLGNIFVSANTGNTRRTTFNDGLSFFAQDDWRVRPNLTLNLGLRWEYFSPLTAKKNLLSNLDAAGNLAQVGTTISGVYGADLNNFGPRLGVAWGPWRKTVVRAAYGIYYDYIPQDLLIANFTTSAGVATNPVGPEPVLPLTYNPAQFIGTATGPILTPGSPPFSIFVVDPRLRTPYVQSWNLNIQQELGRAAAVEIGYVGSKGTKLVRLYDQNQINPITGVSPNPNFATMDTFAAISNSTYHALQLIGRLSAWHGLSGFTGYTFSKSLDDASDGIDFNFATAALPQNSTNLHAEKGPSTFDSRHRFTAALNYQVPVWKSLPRRLVEGWQLNTIVTAQSGRPIPIINSNDNSGTFNFHQRPDVVAGVNPIISNWTPATGYLNPAAFAQPAGPPTEPFGNLGRNQIYGPGFWDLDFSVTKNTRLYERLNLQFRTEFFNLFNHPVFALPGNSFGSSSFGQVTQTPDVAQGNPGLGGGGPRVLQFALRLQF